MDILVQCALFSVLYGTCYLFSDSAVPIPAICRFYILRPHDQCKHRAILFPVKEVVIL